MQEDAKRFISPSLFATVVVCFALPFVLVQCSGTTVSEVSGFDLVTGTQISAGAYGSMQVIQPVLPAILAFLAALGGIALGFVPIEPKALYSAIAGGVCFLALMSIGVGASPTVSRETGGVATAEWGAGLVFAILLAAAATGYNAYMLSTTRGAPSAGMVRPRSAPGQGMSPPSANGKRFCAECGSPIKAGSQFCDQCGTSIAPSAGGMSAPSQPPPAQPAYTPPVPPGQPAPPQPAAPGATIYSSPATNGWTITLDDGTRMALALGTVRIGRSGDNDVVVADPSVSRQHATLSVDADQITVTDLNSTSGTAINGTRIQTGTLHPGDTLGLGSANVRFER